MILGGLIKEAAEGLYLGEYNTTLSAYNFRLKILMFVKKPKSNALLHKMGLYRGGRGEGEGEWLISRKISLLANRRAHVRGAYNGVQVLT